VEAGLRVAFDIGGTFTDVIVADERGGFFTAKILTLPESVGADVGRCIDEARADAAGEVVAIVHGTTVASNAVLEGAGAVTGLITTQGFRDELEIRRLARPSIYDVFWVRIPPLVPRRRRLEVAERLTVTGAVETPLDLAAVDAAIERLADQSVEAVAVVFLHAYANDAHERAVAEKIRARLPKAAVSTSSEVLPEVREYERMSTTALNAYLMPVVGRYLDQLEDQLSRFSPPLRIMQSNGGVMNTTQTRRRPVHMIESGPAAGVLAGASLARAAGLERVVAFDMGGTTAKACLIENGRPLETAEGEVGAGINIAGRLSRGAGYAVRVPAYDIAEVGAGGGSLAWVDEGVALRVGPKSAGAEPGPACYGRGDVAPTITDANVVLGYMNPEAIAGGSVPIDGKAAATAVARDLADPLGLTPLDAAHGVHRVANATMSRAIRAVTTERGRDPRDFTLIAFGGSGAIHAMEMAGGLGIKRVYVPLFPGLFSAMGLLMADARHDFVQSVTGELGDFDGAELRVLLDGLGERGRTEVEDPAAKFDYAVDLRYARQSSELTIPVPDAAAAELPERLLAAFHAEHERTYGYQRPEDPVGLVSLRLKVTAPARSLDFTDLGRHFEAEASAELQEGTRSAYFGPQAGTYEAALLTRASLRARGRIAGPFIVEEFDTTIVVPPGWTGRVDDLGNLVAERDG